MSMKEAFQLGPVELLPHFVSNFCTPAVLSHGCQSGKCSVCELSWIPHAWQKKGDWHATPQLFCAAGVRRVPQAHTINCSKCARVVVFSSQVSVTPVSILTRGGFLAHPAPSPELLEVPWASLFSQAILTRGSWHCAQGWAGRSPWQGE